MKRRPSLLLTISARPRRCDRRLTDHVEPLTAVGGIPILLLI